MISYRENILFPWENVSLKKLKALPWKFTEVSYLNASTTDNVRNEGHACLKTNQVAKQLVEFIFKLK